MSASQDKTTGGTGYASVDVAPRLSIVLIVYRMRRQAMNTLYTLSARYQREIDESDYEVVVVENASGENLDPDEVEALGGNFRYFLNHEQGVSPARAINLGFSECRASYVGLMIDGARMVTPRVVRYVLDARAITEQALVAVPGYHIGETEHHMNERAGYNEQVERELLDSVDWRNNGYQLFDIACWSGANPHGFFHPFLESNCMFASRENFACIGDADERFDLPGGGALNLHMYRALGLLPGTRLFVTPGEGSFHQFHGGVTTAESEGRDERVATQKRQLSEIWQGSFHSLRREAVMLGAVTGPALPFMAASARRGLHRFRRIHNEGRVEWADDPDERGQVGQFRPPVPDVDS